MSEINSAPLSPEQQARPRREVQAALTKAQEIVTGIPTDSLSPLEQAKKHTFETALERTKDSPDRTYENTFKIHETDQDVTQQEGIPVDWAMGKMREAALKVQSWADRQKLMLQFKALREHSKPYTAIEGRMATDDAGNRTQFLNRVRQEAHFVSKDGRASHNPDDNARMTEDYFTAENELLGRRELIMPKDGEGTTPPTTTDATRDNSANSGQGTTTEGQNNGTTEATSQATNGSAGTAPGTESEGAQATGAQPVVEATDPDHTNEPAVQAAVPLPTNINPGNYGGQRINNPASPLTSSTTPVSSSSTGPTAASSTSANGGAPTIPPGNGGQTAPQMQASSTTASGDASANQPSSPDANQAPIDPNAPPESYDISILRGDAVYLRRADLLANKMYEDLLAMGGRWNPKDVVVRSWRRSLRPYHVNRYRAQILRELRTAHNPYATFNIDTKGIIAVNNATARIADLPQEEQAYLQTARNQASGEFKVAGQKVAELDDPQLASRDALKKLLVDQVLRPYIETPGMDKAALQAKLKQVVEANLQDQNIGPLLKEYFDKTSAEHGSDIEYFITDLAEVGDKMRQDDVAHRHGLDNLANLVKVRLAEVRMGSTNAPVLNWLDRTVDRIQNGWFAQATNPSVAGVAGAGVLAAAGFGIAVTRVASSKGAAIMGLAVPGFGTGTALLAGVARRRFEAVSERNTQDTREFYGEQVPDGAKRREALDKSIVKKATVDQLLRGDPNRQVYDNDTRGMDVLLTAKLTPDNTTDPAILATQTRETGANREALIRRMAEIKARMDYSFALRRNFTGVGEYEGTGRGFCDLQRAFLEGRRALLAAGMNEADFTTQMNREVDVWKGQLTQDKADSDKAFRNYQFGEYAKTGAMIVVSAAIVAPLFQEGVALGGRALGARIAETRLEAFTNSRVGQFFNLDGARNAIGNAARRVGLDRLAPSQALRTPGGPRPQPGGDIDAMRNAFAGANNGEVNLNNGFRAIVNPADKTVSLIDQNGTAASGLPRLVEQPDGTIKAAGPLPQNIDQILPNWQVTPDQQPGPGALRANLLQINPNVDGSYLLGGQTIDVKSGVISVQGTSLRGTVDQQGFVSITGSKSELDLVQQALATQGITAKVEAVGNGATMDSIHDQIRQFLRTNSGGQLGGEGAGIKTFTTVDGMQIRITPDGSHAAELFDPKTGVTLKGTYDENANIILKPDQNPGMDMTQVQKRLEIAGMKSDVGSGPEGTQTVNALEYLNENKKVELANRASWHDNQTPMHLNERGILVGADGKELQFYHHVLPDGQIQLDASQMVSQLTPQGTWQNWDLTTDNQYNKIMQDIRTDAATGERTYHNFQYLITVNDAADNARQVIAIDMNTDGTVTIPDEYKQFFKVDENGKPIQLARFIEVAHVNADGTRNILSTSVGQGIDTMDVKTQGASSLTVAPPDVTTNGDPNYLLRTTFPRPEGPGERPPTFTLTPPSPTEAPPVIEDPLDAPAIPFPIAPRWFDKMEKPTPPTPPGPRTPPVVTPPPVITPPYGGYVTPYGGGQGSTRERLSGIIRTPSERELALQALPQLLSAAFVQWSIPENEKQRIMGLTQTEQLLWLEEETRNRAAPGDFSDTNPPQLENVADALNVDLSPPPAIAANPGNVGVAAPEATSGGRISTEEELRLFIVDEHDSPVADEKNIAVAQAQQFIALGDLDRAETEGGLTKAESIAMYKDMMIWKAKNNELDLIADDPGFDQATYSKLLSYANTFLWEPGDGSEKNLANAVMRFIREHNDSYHMLDKGNQEANIYVIFAAYDSIKDMNLKKLP